MTEVAQLGDWFSAELEPEPQNTPRLRRVEQSSPQSGAPPRQESSLDAPNAVLTKRGLQLPTGLPEASASKL